MVACRVKILSCYILFILIVSNIFTQAKSTDPISTPDLFFSVDAHSIEQSGISKKIESKYPFLREWAETLNQDLNKSADIYDAIGLSEDDFTRFSFRLDGLNSMYKANSVDVISLSQIYLEMNLEAKAPMDLSGFMNWLEAELASELRSKKAVTKVLFDQVMDANQLQFAVDLKELHALSTGNSQDVISLDSNFSVHISSDKNQTNFRGVLTNPVGYSLIQIGNFEKNSLLSQLAPDRQVSFYFKIPDFSSNYLPQSKGENPFSPLIDGVSEVVWGASFRDDSVLFQLIVACKENSVATALEGLFQGSLGMVQLGLMEDPTARNMLDLIQKVEVQTNDNLIDIRIELTEKELAKFISNQLSSAVPTPPLHLHTSGPKSMQGKEAPSVLLPTFSGKEFLLSSNSGKVVVLDFWASWSRPCRTALPILMKVQSGYASSEFCLMTINQAESQEEISDFLSSYDLGGLPVAMDLNGEISKKYHVQGMPHTVIINQLGEIEKVWVGFSPFLEKDLVKEINRILGK
jgi:thiol-disulfide isomerase/thioredoxin